MKQTKNKVNDSAMNQTRATEETLDDKPAETAQATTQPADSNNVDKPTSPSTTQLEINITNNDCDLKEAKALTTLPLPSEKVSFATPLLQKPTSSSTVTSAPLTELTDKKDTQPQIETRACTVRLEILTESDMIKHVHVHRNVEASVETVETERSKPNTRLSTRTKVPRSGRHPRSTTKNADYSNVGSDDSESLSPAPKKQHHSQPRREPSSSRIKSDSFIKKQPTSHPLRHSLRTTVSSVTPSSNKRTTASPSKPATKTTMLVSSKKSASKGTFET